MNEQAPDKIVKTKKELVEWLIEKEQWWVEYGNPFQEAEMVTYILRGLERLEKLGVSEDTLVVMYPSEKDGELLFMVGEA